MVTFSVDSDEISIVNQMMLMNVPRNQEVKRKARSLINIRNALVRLAITESHQQVRVIALDHFLFKCRNRVTYSELTPLTASVT